MYTSVHYNPGTPLHVAGYLSRHDVVYNTPALKPHEGLPLGNGTAGILAYHTPTTLELPLNHTSAVDYAEDGAFRAWAWEREEKNTAPYHPGHLRVRSPLPLFDWVYLEEFEERLSLGDATLLCKLKTPMAKLEYRVFTASSPRVMAVDWLLEQEKPAALTLELERFGTPNFFHHYEQVVRTFDRNLAGTELRVLDDGCTAAALHTARGSASAVAARVVYCHTPYAWAETSARSAALELPAEKVQRFTLLVAVETAATAEEALQAALTQLDACGGVDDLHTAHGKHWADFWQKSYVHLPKDDYVENLYYLHRYAMGCCCAGENPPLFGGVWTPFGDSRNWGHFYHWNHQQTNWGLHAAGHSDLCRSYLDYRWRMRKNARADAKQWHDADGVFYSDISNLNGYNAPEPDTLQNYTVGAQIALDFWRYGLYTADETFMAERAVPMLRDTLAFYASLLAKGEDGYYRIRGGATAYESYWNLRETLTDYAAIHAVFAALQGLPADIQPPDEEMTRYAELCENLYPCPTTQMEHKGETLDVFADGVKWDGKPVGYAEGEYPLSPFPATLFAMVYPASVLGLSDAGTEFFRLARNTARVLFDNEVYTLGKLGCSGHAPSPQTAARLGMGNDTMKILRHFGQTYQVFPSGLMHFADIHADQQWSAFDIPRVLEPNVEETRYEEIHNKGCGTRTRIASERFLHPYFEASACLFDGLNEALLQSHQGIVRLFPAVEKDTDAQFCLWAQGLVQVQAEMQKGRTLFVSLTPERDTTLRLANPWPKEQAGWLVNGEPVAGALEGEVFTLQLKAGEESILSPASTSFTNYYYTPVEAPANSKPKHSGKVQIGLDAIY